MTHTSNAVEVGNDLAILNHLESTADSWWTCGWLYLIGGSLLVVLLVASLIIGRPNASGVYWLIGWWFAVCGVVNLYVGFSLRRLRKPVAGEQQLDWIRRARTGLTAYIYTLVLGALAVLVVEPSTILFILGGVLMNINSLSQTTSALRHLANRAG